MAQRGYTFNHVKQSMMVFPKSSPSTRTISLKGGVVSLQKVLKILMDASASADSVLASSDSPML